MMSPSRPHYLLAILLVILTFNFLDRSILAIALQDIKADLALSDTQLGFLSGIAFALFYSVAGIPIARWADRGNRVSIIAITTALWSGLVALCGMAGSFAQLLLIRVGVAVGEAGCVPPAHSLIADTFSRAQRPRAVSIYMLGGPLSIVVGYFLAGWLNELYGWRATFVILGAPGLLLALLAHFTLKEPPRRHADAGPPPDLKRVISTLWSNRTFRHLHICFSITFFFGTGIWQWQPSYFVRSFGLQTGELGTWFALTAGLAGVVGAIAGGEIASRYAARNEGLQLKLMAVGFAAFGVISAGVYLTSDYRIAFALVALATLGGATATGPLFATVQTVVPQHMRATSIAIVYLFANLIGMGLGPLAAGFLSDQFRSWAGEESLRYALLALCPGYLWAALHVWRGSVSVTGDIEKAQAV
ncbi:spinster family MFS transporter [Peristeroidobacter soli]|uniref:spinster family MFS transporter n=1 Tax=Peristeroidobacter soli TaxID=2497877 RepID=UPI001C37D7AC|nr:MFS transporter [Peristeroidobacter soli]